MQELGTNTIHAVAEEHATLLEHEVVSVSSRGKILREMGDDEDKKRLYVGSLSYNTTDESLRAFFDGIGEVSDGKRN